MSLDAISKDGRFAVLAVDHRDSLRHFLRPDDPDSLLASEITELKTAIVRAVGPLATGVMLEPEYSIPQLIDNGAMPPGVGFLAALEAQGYLATPGSSPTEFLPGWSPQLAADAGAAGCKLLLPFHPDRPLADQQVEVAQVALAACHDAGLPLILEPLFYALDDPTDRRRVVRLTAERFAGVGPDLLKLPFPVDPTTESDRTEWAEACSEISALVSMPWALLSGGGSFDLFADQVGCAVANGCAGFMVGRALWGEAASADGDREALLKTVVVPRFEKLRAIVAV